jgi:DNA relaxase NicK
VQIKCAQITRRDVATDYRDSVIGQQEISREAARKDSTALVDCPRNLL